MICGDLYNNIQRNAPIKTQIGGAVKNVIAIAAGMCEGLGLGTNGA